ncbi:MAG TPA: S8/S53 family peptidase [Saprospiraceae bacterium]|nr:S8/S53 family peptidase [Saprospiraceae bacterium]
MNIFKSTTLFLMIILCFCSASLYGQSQSGSGLIPGSFIVIFESQQSLVSFIQSKKPAFNGTENVNYLRNTLPIALVTDGAISLEEFKYKMEHTPGVVNILQDYKLEQRRIPNDPLYGPSQWNMPIIKAPQAWEITTGGETESGDEIVVGVLDDGFLIDHPDLMDNVFTNPFEIPDNGLDDDENGYIDDVHGVDILTRANTHQVKSHGTGVMSIIGARGNNAKGMTGINWNVKILPVSNVFTAGISGLLQGYDYISGFRKRFNESDGSKGALVVSINFSGGLPKKFPTDYPIWCEMYESVGEQGILSVCATVNSDVNVDIEGDLPTLCTSDYLIMVTNTTPADVKYSGAGYSSIAVDLGAPGEGNIAANGIGDYSTFGGTSCATPHVTGAVALMYANKGTELQTLYKTAPAYAALTIKNAILKNVDPIPSLTGKTVSGGRLNLLKMMQNYSSAKKSESTKLSIYPNPAQNNLILKLDSVDNNSQAQIKIMDVTGKTFISIQLSLSDLHQLNITDLKAGVYFVSVMIDGSNYTNKFIKQ